MCKLIKEFIKESLLLEAANVEKIMMQLRFLENLVEKRGNGKLEIKYIEDSYGDCIIKFIDHPKVGVNGMIEFERTSEDWADGYALGGYRVRLTHPVTKGFGPLLYEIIIELASLKDTFLMSDRTKVSADALRVWNIYNDRSDIQKVQLVINDEQAEQYNVEQLTPGYIEDDTSMTSAIKDKGVVNWEESSLSKGYYKEKSDITILYALMDSEYIDFNSEQVEELDDDEFLF